MTDTTGNRMISMRATNKPFHIDKRLVYEAYKAVKSNRGAAGVDEQTIEQFEADLSGRQPRPRSRRSHASRARVTASPIDRPVLAAYRLTFAIRPCESLTVNADLASPIGTGSLRCWACCR